MKNQIYKDLIENSFRKLDIDPTETRCEGEGAWLLTRGHVGVYIDLWQSERPTQWQNFAPEAAGPVFQVVCPVCTLPDAEKMLVFEEELLQLNFHMFYGSFTVNRQEKMAVLIHRRLAEGLREDDVLNAILSMSLYAEQLSVYFEEKYGVNRISEED